MADEKMNDYQKHLVQTHLKLAQSEALKAWRKAPNAMEKDEVVQIAYGGLITAAMRFDPEWRPDNDPNYDPFLAFGAFARQRIVGAILDWQKARDHVPRRQRKVYKDLQQLGHGNGKTPEQLADLTGLEVSKIRAITQAVETQALSLDADIDHWNDSPDRATVQALSTDNGSEFVRQSMEALANTIQAFPPIQRSIIVLKYYNGLDFTSIAMELGISVSVVRTYHRDGMDIIHQLMLRVAS